MAIVYMNTPFEYNYKEVDEFVTLSEQCDFKYPAEKEIDIKLNEANQFFHEHLGTGEVNLAEPLCCCETKEP